MKSASRSPNDAFIHNFIHSQMTFNSKKLKIKVTLIDIFYKRKGKILINNDIISSRIIPEKLMSLFFSRSFIIYTSEEYRFW